MRGSDRAVDVKNAVYPSPDQAAAFFGATEDGPFVTKPRD